MGGKAVKAWRIEDGYLYPRADKLTKIAGSVIHDGEDCMNSWIIISKNEGEKPKRLTKAVKDRMLIRFMCDKITMNGQDTIRERDCAISPNEPYNFQLTITDNSVTLVDNQCQSLEISDDIGMNDLYFYMGSTPGLKYDFIQIDGVDVV